MTAPAGTENVGPHSLASTNASRAARAGAGVDDAAAGVEPLGGGVGERGGGYLGLMTLNVET